jgi:hypothetical protein
MKQKEMADSKSPILKKICENFMAWSTHVAGEAV